ncbi:UPF0496 protein At3g19330-like isoform X2 [Humulus lupulus]|uniref:UPF0496 protein At3g19330-like isoform X2 n=1 Tax=Humulus lupulus TaxID=3486 RepID=UPI002B406C3B|nr:UPF0496 protein At3g19330-like isoform X2 [Humulus lupulus]XP_062105305.1 UPF0496 protein At3g19330-like isoform X2 [Humulus lupulus]
MLHHCLILNPSPSPSPLTNGHYHYQPQAQAQADFAADGDGGGGGETASVASTQPSPNLAREYSNVLQSLSYQEIRSTVEVLYYDQDQNAILERVLNPNRDCVEEALRYAKPNTLTRLVSEYFEHSEYTTQLCLHLQQAVARARELYAPLHDLLQLLPADSNSLSESHCNWANETFLKFDALHNPFSFPDDTHHNFDHIRGCFSNLRKQLDRRLRKSRSLIRILFDTAFFSRPVVLTTRALTSLVVCTALPMTKKVSRVAQLDAAAKGTYVLHEDLNTIKSLVDRLQSFIEEDKVSVRMGLDSCGERHLIHEVVKQLRKNHSKIVHQLDDLEDHIYLCFNTVNKARLRLLEQIYLHQTSLSGDTRQTEET